MSPDAKRRIRIWVGPVAGAVVGCLFSPCLVGFVVTACMQLTGRGPLQARGHWEDAWYSVVAVYIIAILPPVAGAVVGILWARRRNQQETGVRPYLETIRDPDQEN